MSAAALFFFFNQKRSKLFFTQMIDLLESSINTKWIYSYTIGVTYDQGHIDLMTENEIEDEAEKLAKIGYDVIK
jgi:hypothetical protein